MSDTHALFLTETNENTLPKGRLKNQDAARPELPEKVLRDDSGGKDDEGMHVRLTAEEPHIPDGTRIEAPKQPRSDEIDLPGEIIREEEKMPRLH